MFEVGDQVQWRVGDRAAMGEVADIVMTGQVPGVAVKIEGPAARVNVIRDGEVTTDAVAIPLDLMDKIASSRVQKKAYKIHKPTEDELKAINAMLPSGVEERTAADTVVVPFVAADNLINRGIDKWDLDSLKKMADLFPGLPMMLDHDWGDVGKVWGKVFSAKYEHSASAPKDAIEASGHGKLNRQIVKDEGFGQVIVQGFTSPSNPVYKAIRDGFIGKVSTGAFYFKDLWCPECDLSFRDRKCPHYPPSRFWGDENDPDIARYAIRTGLEDVGELSVVTLPNLPNAGVI